MPNMERWNGADYVKNCDSAVTHGRKKGDTNFVVRGNFVIDSVLCNKELHEKKFV
jgi:hypothetical protein